MAAAKNPHRPPLRIKTPEQFKQHADEYFDSDEAYSRGVFAPSFNGMAKFIGMDGSNLRNYKYYKGFEEAFKYVANIINNTPYAIKGQKKMYKSEEELQARIDEYFENEAYEDGEFRPTLAGLARKLGMDRMTLCRYGKDEQFHKVVSDAKQRIEEKLERRLNYTESTVAGVIFNLKNNFGYKDRVENYNENKIIDNGDNEF